MFPGKVFIPLATLILSAVLLAFTLAPSSVFDASLLNVEMYPKHESPSDHDSEALVAFSASLNAISIQSSLLCLELISPCKISYDELPNHAIFPLIGKFQGVPGAIHDILDVMSQFKGLIARTFLATTAIITVLFAASASTKSKIYVQIPTHVSHQKLRDEIANKEIKLFDNPTSLRVILTIGGLFGLIELSAVLLRFGLAGAEIYRCVDIILNAIARLPLPKSDEPSLSIHYKLGFGSIAIILSIILLGIGSLLFINSGLTLKDRAISYKSKLVSAPEPPTFTYRVETTRIGKSSGADKTIDQIESNSPLKKSKDNSTFETAEVIRPKSSPRPKRSIDPKKVITNEIVN